MDVEEIKRRKLEALKERAAQEQDEQQQEQARKEAIESMLKQALSHDARARLANIELANPSLAQKVISVIVYLAQSGNLKGKMTDAQLKTLLRKISSNRRETKIKRI